MELTKAETIQMVALITSAYPNHDRFNSEEMIKAMVNVWANGDFDKWLETRIEKEVRANKTEKPEADHTVEAATTAASVAATVASTAVQQLAAEASDATPRE